MHPLDQTRINMSEHSYPTPTRNHLSMHNREAAKRKSYGATRGSEVRFGIRLPSGQSVMALTDSEVEQARKEELTNLRLEAEERKARILRNVHAQMAETDSWAHKR
jgi:hypothetical protein